MKTVSIWVTAIVLAALALVWYLRNDGDAQAYGLASQAAVLEEQGRLAEARVALREAITIRDDVADFHLRLGRVNFRLGNLDEAFVAYDFARSLAPDNLEAQLAVAQIGLQIGEFEKSRDATRILLLENPSFIEAKVVDGILRMIDRDFDGAISAADDILERDPDQEQAIILKVRATLLAENEEEAKNLVREYASVAEGSVGLASTELEVYRALSDPDGMIAAFRKLRKLLPDAVAIQLDEAALYYKLNRAGHATRIAMNALAMEDIEAEQIDALIRLLRLYATPSAILSNVEIVKREGNTDARLELARHLVSLDRPGVASSLIEGIEGDRSNVVRALVGLAEGEGGYANRLTSNIIADDTGNCLVRFIRGAIRSDQGDFRQAIYETQYAVDECPTLLEGWTLLAESYDELGRTEQVDRVFRQAIDLNKQEPSLVDAYVDWLVEKGRVRQALAARRALTRTMPAYGLAWEQYASLCRQADASCLRVAEAGLEQSATMYGLDLPPGERASTGLFGRFLVR